MRDPGSAQVALRVRRVSLLGPSVQFARSDPGGDRRHVGWPPPPRSPSPGQSNIRPEPLPARRNSLDPTVSEEHVRIEVADHVAVVTLARPDKHNALDVAMLEAIAGGVRAPVRRARRSGRSCSTARARASARASTSAACFFRDEGLDGLVERLREGVPRTRSSASPTTGCACPCP